MSCVDPYLWEEMILHRARKYFNKHPDNVKRISDFIIDIRGSTIKWIIENYCKNNKPEIYESYLEQLEVYEKKYFQVHCRGKKVTIVVVNNKLREYVLPTSVCQINFYRWVFESGLYKILIANKDNLISMYNSRR